MSLIQVITTIISISTLQTDITHTTQIETVQTNFNNHPTLATKTTLFPFVPITDAFSVATTTTLQNTAHPQPYQTENHVSSNGSYQPTQPDKTKMENSIVSHGTEKDVTKETHTDAHAVSTSVLSVVHQITPPKDAHSNFLHIITPLVSNAWESALRHANLYNKFHDVPFSIRHGFDMGIFAPPTSTYTPNNHNSALNNPNAVMSHIRKELSCHRYTGPFSHSKLEQLIGPFRTSPLSVVLKAGTNDEFRLVQDFSYPHNDPTHPSINSEINMDNFQCDWGTFNEVSAIVRNAPPFSEAATLDVDAAFRRAPICPSQQSSFVIGWQDLFYIDHAAPFGAASSGGVFGRIADALRGILHSKNITALNWVNDFVLFNFPESISNNKPVFPYNLNTIYTITSPLGLPWKDSKTRPFSPIFKYLGFLWNLTDKTVQIPDKKKSRYLSKLTPWVKGQRFTQHKAESILGTLVHCSLAVPEGRSRLPSLSRFASSFARTSSPFSQCTPNDSVINDIKWWCICLSQNFCGSSLAPPPPPSNIDFWVDASTNWGIGVVFDHTWDSWKLHKNWKSNGHNIRWAEFLAIEVGLLLAIHQGHSHTHFILRSDNQGVIEAIKGGKSRSPEQNIILQCITQLLAEHSLWISSLYVPSASNIADKPSRGLSLTSLPRLSSPLPLPSYLKPFLESSPTLIH